MRQDQLVLQIIQLMDQVLKGVNQNFKLTPYKTLACSKDDGFLEFVPHTKTIQSILGSQLMSEYLKKQSQDVNNPVYNDLRDPSLTRQQYEELVL